MQGPTFLQSNEWQEFQKSIGRKTRRVGGTLLIRHELPAGLNYLYAPRPEVINEFFLQNAQEIAREDGALFFKIDPIQDLRFKIQGLRTRESNPIQPRKTAVLNLQKSEEELLLAMHEKTRYNIRLAERRGVQIRNDKVRMTNDESRAANYETFWCLLQETAKRDGFHTHEGKYYQKLLGIRSDNFSNELFFAEYQGKILTAALINFYKPSGTATYLHGASSREHREVMAPHLLHWEIIKDAKKRGIRHYDLWGIDPTKWPGVTRFKMGFGGEEIEYPNTFDIIYRPFFYAAYRYGKELRDRI